MNELLFSALGQSCLFTILTLILGAFSVGQEANIAREESLAPHSLITRAVDETQLTVLRGNTHFLARPEFDLGTAPATLPMQRMLLVLRRSTTQESALRKLLDDQQDKASPNYHKWLKPEQFGKHFGPSDSDIQAVTSWLQSHGFQVGSTKGRTVLEFSGSASQVQEAFHTTIHKYVVNEEQHWANASDPSIPTALRPAVAGVLTLHNFIKRPTLHFSNERVPAQLMPGKRPQITFPAQNGQPVTYALGPQDYAVIYNINPLYAVDYDGSGTSIAVVGRSNLYNNGQDVQDFDNTIKSGNDFNSAGINIVLNGPDPGDLGGGDEAEATLDSTWSGAIAPGANVSLVVSATTNTTDGIDLSEVYIVENNLAGVMTESFSACELYATDAQLAGTYSLAEQAAAQGITYIVSSGDNGAEGCDDPSTPPATNPLSVNMLASTPFNVAVGGTMFNENGQDSRYWGSEPPALPSAISYIPEDVWNESSLSNGLWSSSGGASAGNILAGGTTGGIAKPAWQFGVTGIPNDGVRDLPDVSLTAGSLNPYVLCLEGSCQANSQGQFYVSFISGTSAAAPSFAGIMALVDQVATGRQGSANYVLYRLAAAEGGGLSGCNASNTSVLPASTCVFNDVTVGNNSVPGELGYPTGLYAAGVGYDQATGLGSVNAGNLVGQWNSVTFNPTTTAFTITGSPIIHGASVPFTASVSPTSGTGTPTGYVSLLAAVNNSTPVFNDSLGLFTLSAGGTIASSTNNLPGGVNLMEAHYSGDTTYAPSNSTWVTVDVTSEPSTTTLSVLTANAQGVAIPFTGGPFGSFVYLRADVAGLSGHGTPTGTVTFNDTFGAVPGGNSFQLNSGDQLQSGSNTASPNGVFNFDTGTHTISASYSGDASFNPSGTTQSLSFTITPGFFAAVPLNQSSVSISAPGSSGSSSVSVSSSTGFSGAITLSCSGLPVGAVCIFSPSSIQASGSPATTSSTIRVTTTAAGAAVLESPARPLLRYWPATTALTFFSLMIVGAAGRRRSPMLLATVLALLVLGPGCGGGGGSSSSPPPPPPTPSTAVGTYNVTVNASSGSTTSSTGFTLFVQ